MSALKRRGFDPDEHNRLFLNKAKALALFCHNNGLAGAECLLGLKIRKLVEFYDGIGPNWSHGVLAKIIRHIDPVFEPAGFLQDIQYHIYPDRREKGFHDVNRMFLENCNRCIDMKYGWWRFLTRRRMRKSAKALFDACEEHGWSSWIAQRER